MLAVQIFPYNFLLFLLQENPKTREVEVDIDELLDMDSDDQRRRHLQVRYELNLRRRLIAWNMRAVLRSCCFPSYQ
jgi:hypothetical protein